MGQPGAGLQELRGQRLNPCFGQDLCSCQCPLLQTVTVHHPALVRKVKKKTTLFKCDTAASSAKHEVVRGTCCCFVF